MREFIRSRYIIHGLVQGVGFRYYVYKEAKARDLKGFVKNLFDGTVECEIESETEIAEEFKNILYKGSSRSHVTKIEVFTDKCNFKYQNFEIL